MEKPNYNQLIKTTRKQKALTQQDLADRAGISLRTVQRIEKGTEEISGYSLKKISEILDIPLEQMIMPSVNQISIDNNQIGSVKTLYLSSFVFLLNPVLGLIVPAIIGFSKQNKDSFYKKHLKNVLRIQLCGLLSVAFFIAYTLIAEALHMELIEPIKTMIDSFWPLLLIPFLYYTLIGGITIYKIYTLNQLSKRSSIDIVS